MARLFAMNERRLSVVVLALFSAWLLAFPFEGQILHALAGSVGAEANQLALAAIAANGAGLLSSGFLVKSHRAARRLMLCAIACGLAASAVFFFPLSFLWVVALLVSSCSMGACLAAWGYYFQSGTPPNERINTAADGIVWANILMIGLNMAAIHLSPYAGLGLSMSMLAAAFLLALRLPAHDSVAPPSSPMRAQAPLSVARPLAFLCLFVLIITVDSGLMYQVLNPAYAHHAWLTSWYWAVPYIVAILVMKGLPRQTNRAYILYVALAMIGFSFIAFMILDRSAASYLLVNTLMLGACGVYDLFWWSILGEMLELGKNPARIFGIGLAANVLGVLLGSVLGRAMASAGAPGPQPTLLALAVVCVSLVLLPPLHRHLAALLKDHAFLTVLASLPPAQHSTIAGRLAQFESLSERERQVATLLLQGKTYRAIAGQLHISENTVKTHTKNIYSKLYIQSRAELIELAMREDSGSS